MKLIVKKSGIYQAGMYPQWRLAPKFSDTLTLFQPRGADSAHHWHGRIYIFLVVTSLSNYWGWLKHHLMANIWEKVKSILAGNLISYLITTVSQPVSLDPDWLMGRRRPPFPFPPRVLVEELEELHDDWVLTWVPLGSMIQPESCDPSL